MLNITVDGHAASGKSVLAKEIAKSLGIKVFETGAMYRALACEWDARNLGNFTEKKVREFLKDLSISVKFIDGKQHTIVNGTDYTEFLRLEKISMLSVRISPFKEIREKVKLIQREFASENDCVMEGRDIGSVVLPNADFKFFITAPVEVRAERRFLQEKEKQPKLKLSDVLEDLKERDFLDETRKIAPLKITEDSIIINTAGKTIKESLNDCLIYIYQN